MIDTPIKLFHSEEPFPTDRFRFRFTKISLKMLSELQSNNLEQLFAEFH